MLALLKHKHREPSFGISNHCPTCDSYVNYTVAFYATVARISEQNREKHECLNAASETDFQSINVPQQKPYLPLSKPDLTRLSNTPGIKCLSARVRLPITCGLRHAQLMAPILNMKRCNSESVSDVIR